MGDGQDLQRACPARVEGDPPFEHPRRQPVDALVGPSVHPEPHPVEIAHRAQLHLFAGDALPVGAAQGGKDHLALKRGGVARIEDQFEPGRVAVLGKGGQGGQQQQEQPSHHLSASSSWASPSVTRRSISAASRALR